MFLGLLNHPEMFASILAPTPMLYPLSLSKIPRASVLYLSVSLPEVSN